MDKEEDFNAEWTGSLDSMDLLKKEEIVEKLKEKAFYIPFLAMGTSLVTLFIGKKLLQTRPLKRPVLFQFGMGILGALVGAQIGALWLQREYFNLDPEGKLLKELKELKVQRPQQEHTNKRL